MALKGARTALMGVRNAIQSSLAMKVSLAGVLLIPVMFAGFYLSAFFDPYSNLHNVDVAVVNMDQGAELNGEVRNIGDEVCEELDKADQKFGWDYVSAEDAQAGLENGDYYMVCTIPEDFSKNIASAEGKVPKNAEIQVQYNEAKNMLASQIGSTAWAKVKTQMNEKIIREYWRTVFDRLDEAGDTLQEAADGAGELNDGLSDAVDGSGKITDGAKDAMAGSKKIFDGAVDAVLGSQQVTDGAKSALAGSQQVGAGINDAKAGADTLSAGISSALAGSSALASGASDLATGSSQLSDGLDSLSAGADSAKQGASDLASGLSDISDGASSLSSGADGLKSSVAAYVAGVDSLVGQLQGAASSVGNLSSAASAASQYASSVNSIVSGMSQITTEDGDTYYVLSPSAYQNLASAAGNAASYAGTTASGVSSLSSSLSSAGSSAAQLTSAGSALRQGASDLAAGASSLNGGVASAKQGASDLAQGTATLAAGASNAKDGASKVAQGAKTLEAGSSSLNQGLKSVDDGGKQLAGGLGTLSAGSAALTSGLSDLSDGSETLTAGLGALSKGAFDLNKGLGTLHKGSATLTDGLKTAKDGSATLADGLTDGASEMKENGANGSAKSEVMCEPVTLSETDYTSVENYGSGFAPFFIGLGIWVGCIFAGFLFKPLNRRLMISGANPVKVAFSGFLPLGVYAMIQAVIAAAFVQFFLGVPINNIPAYYGMTILCAFTFMAIMQFLVAAFKFPGRYLAVVLLTLQLTSAAGTFPVETAPAFYQVISPWMPMTYFVDGMRQIMMGFDGAAVMNDAIVLAVFMLLFFALTALLAYRKRTVSIIDIHPLLEL